MLNPHGPRSRLRSYSHSHPQRPRIEDHDDQPAEVRSSARAQQQLPPLPISRDCGSTELNPSAHFALASPTIFLPAKLQSDTSAQSPPVPPPPPPTTTTTPRRSKLKRPSSSSASLSARLSNWGSVVDLSLLQRRRSTGKQRRTPTSPTTPRQDPIPPPPPLPPQMPSPSFAHITPQKSHATPATVAKRVTGKDLKSPSPLRLSTPDRAILEELRRSLTARQQQFVLRGGVEHHPHPASEVPYPRAYGRENIDLDSWETLFLQQLCGSPTWHVFKDPPTKVLDLGCGNGAWILDCARQWKHCHFVGLDIVPLHPDLTRLGSSNLASRVTWVQANFLEILPFPNEEFDYVHIKRIARGVPEDKWDALFEEITRVMKPGAAFEMIEDDLSFPGKPPTMETERSEEPSSDNRGHLHQYEDAETDTETEAESPVVSTRYGPGSTIGSSSDLHLPQPNPRRLLRLSCPSKSSLQSTSLATDSLPTTPVVPGLEARVYPVSGDGANNNRLMFPPTPPRSSPPSPALFPNRSDRGIGSDVAKSNFVPKPPPPPLTLLQDAIISPRQLNEEDVIDPNNQQLLSIITEQGEPDNSEEQQRTSFSTSTAAATSLVVNDASSVAVAVVDPQQTIRPRPRTRARALSEVGSPSHDSRAFPLPPPPHPPPTAPLPPIPLPTLAIPPSPALLSPPLTLPSAAPSSTDISPSLTTPSSASISSPLATPSSAGNSLPASGTAAKRLSRNVLARRLRSRSSLQLLSPASLSNINLGRDHHLPPSPTVPSSPTVMQEIEEIAVKRSQPPPPSNPRDHTVLELIYDGLHASRFINLAPLSLLPNTLSIWFKDVRTHPPLEFTFPPLPEKREVQRRHQHRHTRQQTTHSPTVTSHGFTHDDWIALKGQTTTGHRKIQTEVPSLKTLARKRPSNISMMNKDMKASRYSVSSYSDDMGASSSPWPSSSSSKSDDDDDNDQGNEPTPGFKTSFMSIEGLVRGQSPYVSLDVARLSGLPPTTKSTLSFPSVESVERRYNQRMSVPTLHAPQTKRQQGQQQPIADAGAGAGAGSGVAHRPRRLSTIASTEMANHANPSLLQIRLPNTTIHFDIRTLNMHLASRAAEVLACREDMWDWVIEYQRRHPPNGPNGKNGDDGCGSHDSCNSSSKSKHAQAWTDISELTRSDFDRLLTRFEQDMRSHMGLAHALEERLRWSTVPWTKTDEREAFEAECEQWAAYQRSVRLEREREEAVAVAAATAASAARKQKRQSYPHQRQATTAGTVGSSLRPRADSVPHAHHTTEQQSYVESESEHGLLTNGIKSSAVSTRSRKPRTTAATTMAENTGVTTPTPTASKFPRTHDHTGAWNHRHQDVDKNYLEPPSPTHRMCRALRVFVAWKA